jgi:hypothetical protein
MSETCPISRRLREDPGLAAKESEHIAGCQQCRDTLLVLRVIRGIPAEWGGSDFEPETLDCLSDEQISAVAAGELPETEAEPVSDHLLRCVRCREMVAACRRVLNRLGDETASRNRRT